MRFPSALKLVTLALLCGFSYPAEPVTNDDKVTICHKNKNTLSVDSHAVPAHLAHGDSLGSCDVVPF